MLERLEFKQLKFVSRLYGTLPRVFLSSISESLSRYLHTLWPDSPDIPANKEIRQTLEKKFLNYDRVPMKKEYPNTNPWNYAVRSLVRWDLFCGNCYAAEVNPYKDYWFEMFPDFSPNQYGRWISGIRGIPEHHWRKVDRFFQERLGNNYVKFWPDQVRLSDLTLLELGYLVAPRDDDLCTDDYWSGDRRHAGADKRLLLTEQCRALPIFRYLGHLEWTYNHPMNEFQLKRSRGRFSFNEMDFLKKCRGYARHRYKYWGIHKNLISILRRMDERSEKRRQLAERLTATLGK
jgi:hypothetical protein